MSANDSKILVTRLHDAVQERNDLQGFFALEHPEEWARLQDMDKTISSLQEEVKHALRSTRETGVAGFTFKISVPKKSVVDRSSFLARMEERGDLHVLQEYGVVEYSIVPQQIERLPGQLQAVYSGFVSQQEETPRISLPKDLS